MRRKSLATAATVLVCGGVAAAGLGLQPGNGAPATTTITATSTLTITAATGGATAMIAEGRGDPGNRHSGNPGNPVRPDLETTHAPRLI